MKRSLLPLNALRVFDAAARSLSFTRAADELAVTPAAVGQQIRALEESLSVTLAGRGDELFLSAITSGGSQAVFFKINTWGEEAFLDALRGIVEEFGR